MVAGQIYHVFNASMANFTIFRSDSDFDRMMALIQYYQVARPARKFSEYIKSFSSKEYVPITYLSRSDCTKLVEIISYCIMPMHPHMILYPLKENAISIFMSNVLNSYTRYFNIKYDRKGPLWEGRSKKVLVKTDEQLLHLTRYVHLNPVTAYLVDKPEDWTYSSYNEYVGCISTTKRICAYDNLLNIDPILYKEFVYGGIESQRALAKAKKATSTS